MENLFILQQETQPVMRTWSEDIHFIPAERYYEYLEQQYYQDKPGSDESLTQEYYYTANVYNIEVEDYHTYFVGKVGVWVHNSNGCFGEVAKVANKFKQ